MVIILYDLLEDFRKIIQQTEKEALIITLLSIPETPLHLGYGYYRSVILVFPSFVVLIYSQTLTGTQNDICNFQILLN